MIQTRSTYFHVLGPNPRPAALLSQMAFAGHQLKEVIDDDAH
jgi:hypothetical protein